MTTMHHANVRTSRCEKQQAPCACAVVDSNACAIGLVLETASRPFAGEGS